MMRGIAVISFFALLGCSTFGQSTGGETPPAFDIADVHVSPHITTPNMRGGVLRAGRYALQTATMVDLIRTAYNVDADKVLSGPSWLEIDRLDVIAKASQNTSPERLRLMLQTLLADRFKLVVRKDTHALPAFSLTVAKGGAKLKEADGSEDTGCKFTTQPIEKLIAAAQAQIAAAQAAGGQAGGFTLQPTYEYGCKNTTLATFAEAMHTMPAGQTYFGTSIVVDQTGLKGAWNFDLKYTPKPPTNLPANVTVLGGDPIPLFDAVEKQLGLKLDPITFSTPVLIVESVNRKPTDNPPGVTTSLPVLPTEFEVADLRLSDPKAPTNGPSPGFQPSGRVDLRNYVLRNMLTLALNPATPDMLGGLPKWADTVKVDLIAKMPSTGAAPTQGLNPGVDLDVFRPALLALLKDRFKLATHTEERPVDAYTLTAAKPKLRPTADPLVRTNCKEGPGADGKDPRTANPVNGRLLTCQNMTMAQFAEQLPLRASGYIRSDVLDATGLDGAYDFTLNFAANGPAVQNGGGGGRGGDAGQAGAPGAADPNGAISLFDALTKQLGLKLEMHKRPMPVIVIDHIDEKPADN